jgi:hypothetical protein
MTASEFALALVAFGVAALAVASFVASLFL